MVQSPGWKKGFGHNQQGTASPVEVSLPCLSKHTTVLQPIMFPRTTEGSSSQAANLSIPLDGIICVH